MSRIIHFNNLMPDEAERLAMLAEEAAEVIQIVGKIQRHGYESFHPVDPNTSNRRLLERELLDLRAVIQEMDFNSDIDHCPDDVDLFEIWRRKLRFTHHQRRGRT